MGEADVEKEILNDGLKKGQLDDPQPGGLLREKRAAVH